jgi:cytochrome P450
MNDDDRRQLLDSRDPLDPAFLICPYEGYAELRKRAPVWKVPGRKFYLVTGYQEVVEALKLPAVFSANYPAAVFTVSDEVAAIQAEGEPIVNTLAHSDPPVHARYRALVNKAFTPTRVNAVCGGIEELANRLVDDFVDDGTFDMVSQFGFPLTMTITADQLGLQSAELPRYKEWSDARMTPLSLVASPDEELAAARKRVEFQKYFRELFEQKRKAPTDDMISVLAQAHLEGSDHGLTVPEFLSIAEQMMAAGNITTTHAFASAMFLLATNEALMAELLADLGRLPAFIEEALRLEAPGAGIWRVTTIDTELGGTSIPKGSPVHMRLAAANRDDEHFENAECPVLDRVNPRSHLTFGYGGHACIGMLLARRELEIGLGVLLKRLPGLRLADAKSPPTYEPSFAARGLARLQLAFDLA